MSLSNNLSEFTIIKADCLAVLERLDDRTVDLVYLDPPWNTGNDFIFISDSNDDYESLILKVLQQSKRVLKDDGNVILHSVPSLNVDFHNLLSIVFGKENFRAEFILPIKKTNIRNKMFHHNHETIINYVVSNASKFFPLVERSNEEIEKQFPLEEGNKRYRLQTLTIHGDVGSLNYDWKGFVLPKNVAWRYSKKRMNDLENEGKIFFEKGMNYPKLKVYSSDFSLQTVDSVWNDIASYEVKTNFSGQQSEKLLDRIIQLFTLKGDIILDPFAGSGTSGASAITNNRKWIGIEQNEQIFKLIEKRLQDKKLKVFNESTLKKLPIIFDTYFTKDVTAEAVYLDNIRRGESERLEFKEMYIYNHHTKSVDRNMPNKIVREVVAFLNSKYGGELIIGVEDNGEIIGIAKDLEYAGGRDKSRDGLELTVTNKIKDTLGGAVVDLVSINFIELKKKLIMVLGVSPTKNPIFYNDEFIVRNGTTSVALKAKQFHDLMKERKRIR